MTAAKLERLPDHYVAALLPGFLNLTRSVGRERSTIRVDREYLRALLALAEETLAERDVCARCVACDVLVVPADALECVDDDRAHCLACRASCSACLEAERDEINAAP